eukprot:c21431_g1_i2 orf=488-2485(+)
MLSLHTTNSWQFLGLEKQGAVPDHSLWRKAQFGRDVIIGLFDTGVWPEAESFNDEGMGAVPSKWRGICESGPYFSSSICNRKLIGARFFNKGYRAANFSLNATQDYLSPRDKDGHGTHTSSTAAGRFVQGANVFGFANGTAKGGAPLSRVAVYKVCWAAGCNDADILSAFDAAMHDGVDVLSLSIGNGLPLSDYFADSISIGSFHAMQRGKIVVCSAGNDGPKTASVANVAPWILTVAASSINRDFPSYAVVGDNRKFKGASLSEYHLKKGFYPLVSGLNVKYQDANNSASQLCFAGSLDPEKTKGKIVACLRGITARVEKGEVVRQAGGAGMILCNAPSDGDEILSDPHVLPATQVTAEDGTSIFRYLNSTRSPVSYITHSRTVLSVNPAPVMASFSSQGPNSLTPDILKPDITGPGLNILAAWTGATSPTASESDHRRVKFNVISGTSMSCPHVAGIAALLRALYPQWSAAAIKSAIMTTATQLDNSKETILNGSMDVANPFNYGAGHVNPNAATDPGLVYDLAYEDYFLFLCSLKYNQSSLKVLTGKNYSCPSHPAKLADLNYPSISLSNLSGVEMIVRTVTNTAGKSIYKVVVNPPPGVTVSVTPSELNFSRIGEQKKFHVKFQVEHTSHGNYVFGHFTWTDGMHRVRSPIVVNATSKHLE